MPPTKIADAVRELVAKLQLLDGCDLGPAVDADGAR